MEIIFKQGVSSYVKVPKLHTSCRTHVTKLSRLHTLSQIFPAVFKPRKIHKLLKKETAPFFWQPDAITSGKARGRKLKCNLVHEHLRLTHIRFDSQVFGSNGGCLMVIAATKVILTSRSFVFICVLNPEGKRGNRLPIRAESDVTSEVYSSFLKSQLSTCSGSVPLAPPSHPHTTVFTTLYIMPKH